MLVIIRNFCAHQNYYLKKRNSTKEAAIASAIPNHKFIHCFFLSFLPEVVIELAVLILCSVLGINTKDCIFLDEGEY